MSIHSVFTSSPLKLLAMAGLIVANPAIEKASAQALQIQDNILRIGNTAVHAIVYKNITNPSNLKFVSLHNNEQLLNSMVIANIIDKTGTFVMLEPPLDNDGNLCRWVRFSIGGQALYFDPNRMWDNSHISLNTTADCVTNTFAGTPNPNLLSQGRQAVIRFRDEFVRLLGIDENSRPGYLVSVHNNRGLRFDSKVLIPDDCATRHPSNINPPDDITAGDFFLVTSDQSFNYYSGRGSYNVVLQTPATLSTPECRDGSLSIFAQSKGIPFTTVEVNYGNNGRSALDSQKKAASMLTSVFSAYTQLFDGQ
jgi:hypothetical protein